jgi:hypothetical protein
MSREPEATSSTGECQGENVPVPQKLPGFYELLDSIRLQPELYTGRKSLQDFRMFLLGYQLGRIHSGIAPSHEEQEFREFDYFIQQKYRWYDVGGWAAKIQYFYWNDANALDEFFKLFDEFRESKRKKRERKQGKRRRSDQNPKQEESG